MSSKVLCYTNQSDGSLDICINCAARIMEWFGQEGTFR